MKLLIISNLGQWLSCVLLGVGVSGMLASKWDKADTLITVGAVVFSAFTKVKLIAYEIMEAQSKRRLTK
jgi:uncharacterized membrane protein